MDIKVGKKAIAEATEKLKNWGRWGKDDQIGTLNHVRPEDIVKTASLVFDATFFLCGVLSFTGSEEILEVFARAAGRPVWIALHCCRGNPAPLPFIMRRDVLARSGDVLVPGARIKPQRDALQA